MDHFFELIRDFIKERISNPITTTFAISWALWNYKFIIIILSNNTVSTTFELVRQHSFTDLQDVILRGLILPTISTALYIFAYPIPTKFAYEFSLKRNLELTRLKNQIEDNEQLTVEESKKIRVTHAKQIEEYKSTLQEKEEQIKALIEQINSKDSTPKSQKITDVSVNTKPNEIDHTNDLEENALSFLDFMIRISDENDFITSDSLNSQGSFLETTKRKIILSKLKNEGLIQQQTKEKNNGFTITPEGYLKASAFRHKIEKSRI